MCLIWRNWINKAQESTNSVQKEGRLFKHLYEAKHSIRTESTPTPTSACYQGQICRCWLWLWLISQLQTDRNLVHMVYWALLFIFQLYWSWVDGRGAPCPQHNHTCTKGVLQCGSGDRELAVQHTQKHTAHAGAPGEPEQSQWSILCSSEGFISGFQPQHPHSCLQKDKQDNQSQIHFHKTLLQPNSQCKRSWVVLTPEKKRASDLGQKRHKLQNSSEADQKP